MAQAIRAYDTEGFDTFIQVVRGEGVEHGQYMLTLHDAGRQDPMLIVLDEDTARSFALSILRWTGKHMTVHNVPEQNEPTDGSPVITGTAPEKWCAEFKRLDVEHKTPHNSPLHHDNRCPIHK